MNIHRYKTLKETQAALEYFHNRDIKVLEVRPELCSTKDRVVERFYIITDEKAQPERFEKSAKNGSEDVNPF